jgi:hypothetical protein
MNEYNSFCMLESSMVIFGFSKWNFCSLFRSVGIGWGHSVRFLIRFVVHCVEFSAINWLFFSGVGASVISIA